MTTPRPRCSVFIATSLDGFIARKDGGLDFLSSVERAGEDYGYADFASSVDAIVMGRATYDVVVGFSAWPYTGKRLLVMTHRPIDPKHGEEACAGDPRALVERLGGEGVKRIYVDGGVVVRAFLRAGLVDDMVISVIPTLLGEGLPLFGEGTPERKLVLEASRAYESGLVQLRYRVEAG